MKMLTEKLSKRNEIDLIKEGFLPEIKELNCCIYSESCPDIKKLNLSLEEGVPNKDLSDQYYELCTHPSEEARKMSCLIYKNFENPSWKDMSVMSRTTRKSRYPYFFVREGGMK
jgi:hypothetical protein